MKINLAFKKNKMHIDGIKALDVVNGYKIILEKNQDDDQDIGSKYSYDDVKKI